MFNETMLKIKAKEFALKYWGLNFDLPVKINGKLSMSSGKYVYWDKEKHVPLRIDLSKSLIEHYKDETIIAVLKHELCHWALASLNKPFHDGDLEFERELRRIGAIPTNTLQLAGVIHKVACGKCNNIVVEGPTKKSINRFIKDQSRYVSNCCNEKIIYSGTIYREDKNVIFIKKRNLSSVSNKFNIEKGDVSMTVSNQSLVIEDLIQPNKRNQVTNAQMIPAIVKAIEEDSRDQLELLKEKYPTVFEASSTKYLNKTHKTDLERIMGNSDSEEQEVV